MEPGAIAFFDLDGTLVVGQTQQLLVSFLRRRGLVGWRYLLGVGIWFGAYKLGLVKVTDTARAKGAELIAGQSVDDIDRLMDEFVKESLEPRLHPGAMAALNEHKLAGDTVVVLSAAIAPLVRSVGRMIGVEACEGTRLEVAGGLYTGHIEGLPLYGPEKARFARRYAEDLGVDPARCAAYADHETDIDLLRLVGRPVAVNPRPGLLSMATAEGWPVLA
jgi:HAD superfamily hydrolase (TIGR01490 family)